MDVRAQSGQDNQAYDVPILPPRYVLHFLRFMEARGIGPQALLEGTGLSEERLNQPHAGVNMNQLLALIGRAADLVEDETAAFEFGKELDLNAHGLVGAAMLWQNDYFRLIEMIVEYERVCLPIQDLVLTMHGADLHIQLSDLWDLGRIRPFMVRVYMGSIYELSRHVCREVTFEFDFSTRLSASEWQAVAPEATLSFGTGISRAVIRPTQSMVRDFRTDLASFIARLHSRRQMEIADNVDNTTRLVREQIFRNPGSDCTLEKIADQLGMTPRSLRRHLRSENCSFRDLRNEIRRIYAERYISDTRLPLSLIAQKLGFSDQASFTRAYRAWTGRTPGETRRGLD